MSLFAFGSTVLNSNLSFLKSSILHVSVNVVRMSGEGRVWHSPMCLVPSILIACFLVPSVQGVVGVSREGGWDTPRRVAWSISREGASHPPTPTLLHRFASSSALPISSYHPSFSYLSVK